VTDLAAPTVSRTIPALLDRAAGQHGDRAWLRTDDLELTFASAAALVGTVAQRLGELGVRPGDLVVLTARNEPGYLVALLAATTIGAAAVPVNPRGSEAELRGLLGQLSGPGRTRVIVADADLRDAVRRSAAGAGLNVAVVDAGELASAPTPDAGRLDDGRVGEDDVAVMIPTSGTTGRSKLVMQTHRAHVMAGEGFPWWLELSSDDRLMTSLPLFHTNAIAYSAMGALASGAGLVLLPRFSVSGFLDAARRHRATSCNVVGAMLEALMRQPVRDDDADSPLRSCYTAPSPPEQRHLEIERRFGFRLVCGYGLSESLYGTIWRPGTRPYGTLGHLRQHPTLGQVNQGKVVDERGREVPGGEAGELLLHNPTVTPGYYGMADETALAVQRGWLHTGDLVTGNPDGTYTFVARSKEVIRRRGENLSPVEVEEALQAHPDVVESAVVGVAAGLSDEEIKAYVRTRDGAHADPRALADFVAQRLAAFKVPRFWQFVDEMPHTPTGRVAKHRLPSAGDGEEHDLAPVRRQGVPS